MMRIWNPINLRLRPPTYRLTRENNISQNSGSGGTTTSGETDNKLQQNH